MSVDFNSMPLDEPGLGESGTPMFATAPTYATRTVKKSGGRVAPLAIAAGIVAIGGLAAAGWYATQPRETGMAMLTPGTEVASAPAATAPELTPSAAPAPSELAASTSTATNAAPAKAETPPARVTTSVAAAKPARTRPAATARSAEDAGVNTSATLPAAPQPYGGAAVAPSAPADIAPAPAAPQAVKPAPAEAPPAAATPPVTTPPQ